LVLDNLLPLSHRNRFVVTLSRQAISS